MALFVNNKAYPFRQQTVTQLLGEAGIRQFNGIAVAVNNTVIPKSKWDQMELKEEDKLTVIRATQGG